MDEDDMIGNIVSPNPNPTRGPQSHSRDRDIRENMRNEISYTAPEVYNINNGVGIRKFDAQNSLIFEDEQDNNDIDDRHQYIHRQSQIHQHQQKLGGPPQPSKSKKISNTSSNFNNLTPQFASQSPKDQIPNDLNLSDKNRKSHDHAHDKATSKESDDDEKEEREDLDQDEDNQGSPEFGAEYKPDDYKEKNADDLDDELMAAFQDSESSEEEESGSDEEEEEDEDDDDQEGSVRIRDSTDNAEAATETDDEEEEDEDEDDDNDKDAPMLIQSDSRLAASSNGMVLVFAFVLL